MHAVFKRMVLTVFKMKSFEAECNQHVAQGEWTELQQGKSFNQVMGSGRLWHTKLASCGGGPLSGCQYAQPWSRIIDFYLKVFPFNFLPIS